MSSTNYPKSLLAQSRLNKENPSYSLNLSTEKGYTSAYPYRQNNQPPLRQNIKQYERESLGLRAINSNIPYSIIDKSTANRELNPIQVKRVHVMERSSQSTRMRGVIFPRKEHHSFIDKENSMSIVEGRERHSFGGVMRSSFVETNRNHVEETNRNKNSRKGSIVRREVPEHIVKQESQEAEIVQKVVTLEAEKPIVRAVKVKVKEHCNTNVSEYAPIIMENLKIKDKEVTPKNCLSNHQIPSSLRAKMVDWMIEVLTSYKCSEQTFFIAVNIMDLFLQKTQNKQDVANLHLIGVTCMFMASKYEDIYPLRLKIVCEKIAHRKLTEEQIKQMEMEILYTLEYKITNVTPYEFIMTTIYQLDLKESMSQKTYEYLIRVCMYLTKATVHDYDLMNQQNYTLLAAAVLFVAFKIISKLDKTFATMQMSAKIVEILQVSEESLAECSNRTLNFVKTFDKTYPNLSNLKKFNQLNFEESAVFGSNRESNKGMI